jgi:hypothetical protein
MLTDPASPTIIRIIEKKIDDILLTPVLAE